MKYVVNVRPHKPKKRRMREIVEREMPLRRHKAIVAGIEARDEKLRALKANQMQADMTRLQGTMSQVPPGAVVAVEGAILQLQRDLKDITKATHMQRAM